MSVNRFQKHLLSTYPMVDLLPLNLGDPDRVDRLVRSQGSGDGLFDFLWKDLANFSDDADPAEVIDRVRLARRDIEMVEEAFGGLAPQEVAAPSP